MPPRKKPKVSRPFCWEKWSSRRVALHITYIGWDYIGMAGHDQPNTIEYFLFNALEKTKLIQDRESCEYSRCGRTDKGVSALKQVISLQIRSRVRSGPGIIPATVENKDLTDDEYSYPQLLNSVLPDDIRVCGWAPVSTDFNARFSCTYRTYHYYFLPGPMQSAMNEAAQLLLGEHDFRNFAKIDTNRPIPSFMRSILHVSIDPVGSAMRLTIKGTAFLWHMVRNIMAVLFMVRDGLEKPDVIAWLLDTDTVPCKPTYEMASDRPLILSDCGFDGLEWQETDLSRVLDSFSDKWTHHVVGAAMLGDVVQYLRTIHHIDTSQAQRHTLLKDRATRASIEVIQERIEIKAKKHAM